MVVLILEGIVLSGLFTLLIVPSLYKNPHKHLRSYPPEIRKRVESLPDYRGSIKAQEKKLIIKKMVALVLCVIMFTLIAYCSEARTFSAAFWHTFILFFMVNVYDLIVLDIIVFCQSKKVIIKGTEDMIQDYKNPVHHIKGAVWGIFFGLIVALVSGCFMVLVHKL
jgi:small-conductance mechanosensitive channel